MRVEVDTSALRSTKPHECVVRFAFGGLITAVAGVIAKKFGPGVAGLFLAFPAIFPASATMIEKHEDEKKRRERGRPGIQRGRAAAAVDAAGAGAGALGLVVFALVVWLALPGHSAWMVLVAACLSWSAVSVLFWYVRERI